YNAAMKLPIAVAAICLTALLCAAAAPDAVHGNDIGNPAAPILIEVFSDFQCPACKRFHDEELPLIVKDYVKPGKVYIVYRYFPLPQHKFGMQTAELASAGAQIGKFCPVADAFFAKQTDWSQNGNLEGALATVLKPAELKHVMAMVKDPNVQ